MNNKTFTQEETYKLGFENGKNAAKDIVLAKSIMIKDAKVPSLLEPLLFYMITLLRSAVREIEACETDSIYKSN